MPNDLTSASATHLLDLVAPFEHQQQARCRELGIDTTELRISHVAYRCRTWTQYQSIRTTLEGAAVANLENVWNGRPISKILLRDPLVLHNGATVDLIELIPPYHQRVYAMGYEHIGYIVGETSFNDFVQTHAEQLTGQQFQSPVCRPVYRLFEDYTHVKFYERGLQEVCELEGARFDGFHHVPWQPASPHAGPYEID